MEDNQALFNQALTAARAKDFETARTLLKQLMKQDPNNLNAWLLAGMVVASNADAIRCYKRALQIDPNNAHARQKLAQLEHESPVEPPSTPKATGPVQRPEAASTLAAIQSAPPAGQAAQGNSQTGTGFFIGAAVLVGILCLAFFGILIFSLKDQKLVAAEPTPTNQQLFNVIYKNARAFNSEDTKTYMSTIHSKSAGYDQTETLLKEMFVDYNLEVRFSNLEVISASASESKIRFSLTTRQ